jgi:hypothetical protein
VAQARAATEEGVPHRVRHAGSEAGAGHRLLDGRVNPGSTDGGMLRSLRRDAPVLSAWPRTRDRPAQGRPPPEAAETAATAAGDGDQNVLAALRTPEPCEVQLRAGENEVSLSGVTVQREVAMLPDGRSRHTSQPADGLRACRRHGFGCTRVTEQRLAAPARRRQGGRGRADQRPGRRHAGLPRRGARRATREDHGLRAWQRLGLEPHPPRNGVEGRPRGRVASRAAVAPRSRGRDFPTQAGPRP